MSRTSTLAARIANTAVFAGVDEADLTALAKIAVQKSLRPRQLLYARSERGDALVLVLTGRLHVMQRDARAPLVLRSLGTDALVGLSTVAGAVHSADIVAAEASEVLLIAGKHVRALLAKRPDIAMRMITALGALVSELSDDVASLRTEDIESRARQKILQMLAGRREVVITHAALAALIGASRANTSRALARLEAQGLLRRRRGRIQRAPA